MIEKTGRLDMDQDFIDFIRGRRSIRKYHNDPVEKETIEQIIRAGKYSPSTENSQPWRFIIITNPELINTFSNAVKGEIKKLLKWRFIKKFRHQELRDFRIVQHLYGASLVKQDSIFFQAPVVIFIVTKQKKFYDESCACCAENMMLAAHALGLGSCWIGLGHFIGLNKRLMQSIGVPGEYHIAASLIFGHPAESLGPPPIRKPCSDVIKWME
jgi:nitroreductase